MGTIINSIPPSPHLSDKPDEEASITRQAYGIDALQSQFSRGLPLAGQNAVLKIAKFTHGVATTLSFAPLTICKGYEILGVGNGHAVVYSFLQGSNNGQIKLICYFADSSATNTDVAVLLRPEGILSFGANLRQAWVAPTLLNTWVPYNWITVYPNTEYYKDAFNIVRFHGAVQNATVGTYNSVIFTFPAGYRPRKYIEFVVLSDTTPTGGGFFTAISLQVRDDGSVLHANDYAGDGGSRGGIIFGELSFLAEQ